MIRFPSAWLSVTLACTLAFGSMAAPAIGIAVARGYFEIDNSKVYGNSTVFDGSKVLTREVGSELQLNTGAHLLLGSQSQARVFRDRAILERNQAQVRSGSREYYVEAAGLRVSPRPDAEASVALREGNRLQVAAARGAVLVSKLDGELLARIDPGMALEFESQAAGAASPSTLSGTLQKVNGRFLLTDSTTNVTYQLVGTGLDKFVDKKVEVTGTLDAAAKAAAGASQVLRVISVKLAAGAAGGATAAGMATTTKVIIAGVIIGGAGATAAVIAVSGGGKEPISR